MLGMWGLLTWESQRKKENKDNKKSKVELVKLYRTK